MRWRRGRAARVPAIGLADAKKDGSFDAAGRPTGPAWVEIGFPAGLDDACYALKISGGSLAPLFRDGELLIVSPHAPARPGDRVAARTLEGELLIAELKDQNARTLELKPLERRRFRPRAGAGGDRLDVAHHLGQPIAVRVVVAKPRC